MERYTTSATSISGFLKELHMIDYDIVYDKLFTFTDYASNDYLTESAKQLGRIFSIIDSFSTTIADNTLNSSNIGQYYLYDINLYPYIIQYNVSSLPLYKLHRYILNVHNENYVFTRSAKHAYASNNTYKYTMYIGNSVLKRLLVINIHFFVDLYNCEDKIYTPITLRVGNSIDTHSITIEKSDATVGYVNVKLIKLIDTNTLADTVEISIPININPSKPNVALNSTFAVDYSVHFVTAWSTSFKAGGILAEYKDEEKMCSGFKLVQPVNTIYVNNLEKDIERVLKNMITTKVNHTDTFLNDDKILYYLTVRAFKDKNNYIYAFANKGLRELKLHITDYYGNLQETIIASELTISPYKEYVLIEGINSDTTILCKLPKVYDDARRIHFYHDTMYYNADSKTLSYVGEFTNRDYVDRYILNYNDKLLSVDANFYDTVCSSNAQYSYSNQRTLYLTDISIPTNVRSTSVSVKGTLTVFKHVATGSSIEYAFGVADPTEDTSGWYYNIDNNIVTLTNKQIDTNYTKLESIEDISKTFYINVTKEIKSDSISGTTFKMKYSVMKVFEIAESNTDYNVVHSINVDLFDIVKNDRLAGINETSKTYIVGYLALINATNYDSFSVDNGVYKLPIQIRKSSIDAVDEGTLTAVSRRFKLVKTLQELDSTQLVAYAPIYITFDYTTTDFNIHTDAAIEISSYATLKTDGTSTSFEGGLLVYKFSNFTAKE